MKKYIIISVFLSLFSATNALAETHNHHKHDHSDQEAHVKKVGKGKLVVKVMGMVCSFCAQGVEKNFNAREEVKTTKVDLDTMTVDITLKPGKSRDEKTIEKLIVDAGFAYGGFVEK